MIVLGCLGFCVSFVETWQHGSPPGIQVGLKSMLSKMVNTKYMCDGIVEGVQKMPLCSLKSVASGCYAQGPDPIAASPESSSSVLQVSGS